MEIENYQVLPVLQQLELLWKDGILLGYKIEPNYKVELYKIYSFFVQLKYHLEFKTILDLKILSHEEIKDEYIKSFNQN